jgi:hypothetical protein
MPQPPPNVSVLPDSLPPNPTARQIYTLHESNPACAACHRLMDPIGLGLEQYDSMGAFRTVFNGQPIDAWGALVQADGAPSFADGVGLARALSSNATVHACFVTQMLRYALVREQTATDACMVRGLSDGFDQSSHNVRELMLSIVTSPTFSSTLAPGSTP